MISNLHNVPRVHFIYVPIHVLDTLQILIPFMDTVAKATDVKFIWILQGMMVNHHEKWSTRLTKRVRLE